MLEPQPAAAAAGMLAKRAAPCDCEVRAVLSSCFPCYWAEVESETERETENDRAIYIVLCILCYIHRI